MNLHSAPLWLFWQPAAIAIALYHDARITAVLLAAWFGSNLGIELERYRHRRRGRV